MISRLSVLVAEKEIRDGKRISQREIVEATGLNPNTVSRWMSPEPIKMFSSDTITPLCKYLGCELGELLIVDYTPTPA